MATLAPTSFTKWDMSDDEIRAGSMLSIAQVQVIQNRIAELAEQKLALEVLPENFNTYLQVEAKLSGQIQELQYAVELSESLRLEDINPS